MPEIDLQTVGAALRARRKSLRLPSAQLARRIGVSPTYVWLIEGAKPRSSGTPSRPGERLLLRWMRALGMDREEMYRVMELAGYFWADIDAPAEMPVASMSYSAPPAESRHGAPDRPTPSNDRDLEETMLVARIVQLLRDADDINRRDEILGLLNSYLRWLGFHLENARES